MKISHSKTELYSLCPRKYKFTYLDRLQLDQTSSTLLFGSSIDRALNYILTRKKRNHIIYLDTAKSLFLKHMNTWIGNELVYFKNEAPKNIDIIPEDEKQQSVFDHLRSVGIIILETYLHDIMPLFKQIISVQTKKEIPNEDGDTLVLITDFTAKLQDDRVVIFDNKTTTDIRRNYSPSSVAKSQQLAIYTEFEESKLAGYIALSKKLNDDGKVDWTYVIDTVPEERIEEAFDKVDKALRGIKREEFPCNKKACFQWGKRCEFYNLCHNGDSTGLIKKV